MNNIAAAFGGIPRPERFIRGTCNCDECLEHEATMQALDKTDFPLETWGNPGWDPICFASGEAYIYMMPGLVKLLLTHMDAYINQFLFHLENSDRIRLFTAPQKQSMSALMDYLLIQETDVLKQNASIDDVFRIRAMLE